MTLRNIWREQLDNLIKNVILTPFNVLYKVDPALTLEILFRLKQGYPLDLKDPKTYNEKLQWVKLNDRAPLMAACCDKYHVREYVKARGLEHILNGLLWEGFDPAEIPYDTLPDKFVIKVTHGSTFNIICEDASKLDRDEVTKKCRKWLRAKFIPCYGEWFYGKRRPRVIVEDYIESTDGEALKDYKVFCFNGKPLLIRVDTDRFSAHRDTVYDCDWHLIEGAHMGHGCGKAIEKPECLDELLEYAHILSEPFRHARVDFYITDRITFGEITFTNGAGFDKFSSYEFDRMMGDHFEL